jgi:hypothetical protein
MEIVSHYDKNKEHPNPKCNSIKNKIQTECKTKENKKSDECISLYMSYINCSVKHLLEISENEMNDKNENEK